MQGASGEKRRLVAQRDPSPFFWAQLLPPSTPERHVLRPRLLDLLDGATQSSLTVVVAPAGSGKTSLLASWCARQAEVRTGWLSWDEADRSAGQFWAALAAVVRNLLLDYLDDLQGDFRSDRTPQGVLDILVAVEGGHPGQAVVVLDDLPPLQGESVVATSLEQLVRVLPDWLHIVVSSRQMPQLPIDRLRARGQLSEVLFDELRFSEAESLEVVSRLAPWLAPSEAIAIAERANGWAAGLQLSCLAARAAHAQGSDAGAAAGRTDLMVTDYVWREVLARESPDLIHVLLDVSVVNRLTSALAEELADRVDANTLLLEAESRGLFVTRLGSGHLLEIHDLVRRAMLEEATRRDPDRVRDRHLRAARWFEERDEIGYIALALDQWLAAGEPRSALRLLASHVTELYDSGLEETISKTLAAIPAAVAHVDIDAQIDLAWCELLVDRAKFLDVVREVATTVGHSDHTLATEGRVRMLQAIAATMTGHWNEGGQQALEAMQLLGPASWADPLGRFGWNMVARDRALSESWDDDAPSLQDARTALSRDPERRLSYEGIAALGRALAGCPLDALRGVAGVSAYARVKSMTILRLELATAEALAHRELGDRERARAELNAVLGEQFGPVTHARSLALLELVEISLDSADLEGARKLFGEAEVFIRAEFAAPNGISWLARRGLMVSLAAGDLESAAQWNERVEDKFWWGIGRARLALHRGEYTVAADELAMVTPRCPRHEVTKGLLLARALPDGPEALELYGSIVPLAVGAGMMQTVASEGPEILDVLEQHPWLAPEPWLARVHRAVPPSQRTGVTQIALPGEHLTDRELSVLRMLPSRLTIREIGTELGISVNTVKFHLRVIYRKLGVGSRAEAAAMARSLRRVGHGPRH